MRVVEFWSGVSLMALGGAMALACSSSIETGAPSGARDLSSERVGSLGLRLQPIAGVTVTSLHYTVTSSDPTMTPPVIVSEGNLPTPGAGSSVSFGLPLPVGSGYYLSLAGVSAELNDDVTCTGSYGPFAVAANQSSALNLQLVCVDNTKGALVTGVDVKTDACPHLIVDYALAEPAATDVGKGIQVFASAHDLDNPAEPITYAWSVVDPARAGVGMFTPANAANTTLNCTGYGSAVTVQVTARNHQCQKSLQTVISCTDTKCGDGFVELELGETCDPAGSPGHPADPTCPASCIKVCGNGIAEGDETCDALPFNPAVCNPPGSPNACHIRTCECGDGFLCPPEACDGNIGPNGQPLALGESCSSDCTRVIRAVCGDGIVAGTEQCDAGPGLTRCCTPQCQQLCGPSCLDCEQAGDCFASSDNCMGPAATPFTSAQQRTCTDVMQCIQQSNCLDGAGSLGKCYCGTLSTAACGAAPYDLTQPGAPNGPCAAIMQKGDAGLTTNSAILGSLTGKGRPTGAAGQRLNCQKSDPACAPLCGF
jgi:hypothetical protein